MSEPNPVLTLPMFGGKAVFTLACKEPLTFAQWDKMVQAIGVLLDVCAVERPLGPDPARPHPGQTISAPSGLSGERKIMHSPTPFPGLGNPPHAVPLAGDLAVMHAAPLGVDSPAVDDRVTKWTTHQTRRSRTQKILSMLAVSAMPTGDIVDVICSAWPSAEHESVRNAVMDILRRDDRFTSPERGQWSLSA